MDTTISPPVATVADGDPDCFEHAPCGLMSTAPDGTIIKVNATFLDWSGYERSQLINRRRFQDLLPVAGRIFHDTHFSPLLIMQGSIKEIALEIVCDNGHRVPILINARLKRDPSGRPVFIQIALFLAHNRRAYEEELRLAKSKAECAEATLRNLTADLEQRVAERTQERDRIWRLSQDILAVASLDGTFVSVNPAFTELLGWPGPALTATSFAELVHPDQRGELQQAADTLARGQVVERLEIMSRHQDGSFRWLSWTIVPESGFLYAVGRDITADRQQAETLRKTEDALRQSQKLEAIGKLTGGVAHDFNNILQVIAGNLELLKLDFDRESQSGQRLQAAVSAVGRGANLASQLLSFARRQPLQPVATNLGRILRELDELLRRALGEAIEINNLVANDLWTALADRHQLENVILNLAINARDAMNGEGKLTLEVSNAMLDDYYAQTHSEVTAGEYVLLAVSDTGAGMAPEIIDQVFEPFFTTKREGEGTGLGLSMVYGFVKQSGGHIKIYSEVGVGTTFKIFLPRVHQQETLLPDVKSRPVVGGDETILVVEDDLAVQATTVQTLSGLGYRVLKADDGQGALSILQSGANIDLLFTDVVMPGPVKCTELARLAIELHPGIVVLFTSGYTHNAIVHGGRLDPGLELISKPYRREDLARKIRHLFANKQQELKAPAMLTQAANNQISRENGSPLNILVVEDDLDSQKVLCELLGLLGHEAQGAASAETAITVLETGSVEVLITDVSLPGMSGLELGKRAAELRPELKIVVCSGYGALETEGFEAFSLPKPYDLMQIKAVLSEVDQAMRG